MASVALELKSALREDLAQSQMSIHLIGKNYGLVPEGSVESLPEIQNELAIERHAQGEFARLLWIPPGLQVDDDRQRKVIERFRMDPRTLNGADLLETFLEDLKTVIHNRLRRAEKAPQHTQIPVAAGENLCRVYLICDQRDFEFTSAWADFLFEQRVEVIRPVFEGDEAEIRDYHEENLRTCDGALMFYGSANECWLRRKLRELQKSAGYGRTKPAPVVGITLIPPRTAEKERFRTHEAMVISQFDGFSSEPLRQFVSRLQA
jgi:hypothetical protein